MSNKLFTAVIVSVILLSCSKIDQQTSANTDNNQLSNKTASLTSTSSIVSTGKKFLFDNTKAETAGNADWVIDEDKSTPQRIPTPLQANITSTTTESYWTGALSSWGIALVKGGNAVETLPS